MNFKDYTNSIKLDKPPAGICPELQALWYEAKGSWENAHEVAQEIENKSGALIHAYLHRKEGDNSNARYWYSSARAKFPDCSLEQEWENIVSSLTKD